MIELSLGKMVLLALIALIVLGPEKLPGAARTAGALLRRLRSGWDNVRAEVERELEIEEIKRSAREAVAGAEAAQQQVKDTLKSAHDPFAEAAAMVRLQPSGSSNTATRPEDMTPEERVTNRHLLEPHRNDVSPAAHPAESASTEPAPAENESHEVRSEDRVADHKIVDDRALEGVQSELALAEPPTRSAQDKTAERDTDGRDSDSPYKGSPHGHA